MLNMGAYGMAGPDAMMTSSERAMIEPALSRMLERHGAVSERMMQLADPLALVMGAAMWGSRVVGMKTQQAKTRPQKPTATPAERMTPQQPTVTHDTAATEEPGAAPYSPANITNLETLRELTAL